jgi:hypothetical protein
VGPAKRSGRVQAGGSQPEAPLPRREEPIDRRPELLPDAARRTRLGAIELIAVVVVIGALLALAVWFLFFAHNPLLRP